MSIKCPSNDENGNFKRHIIICCTFISHVEFATKKIRIFETVQKLKNTVWKMVQTVFSERFQTIQNNGLLIRVTDGLGKTVGNSRRFEQNSGQFCPKTVQHLLLLFFFIIIIIIIFLTIIMSLGSKIDPASNFSPFPVLRRMFSVVSPEMMQHNLGYQNLIMQMYFLSNQTKQRKYEKLDIK
jgi:hypothetical protein